MLLIEILEIFAVGVALAVFLVWAAIPKEYVLPEEDRKKLVELLRNRGENVTMEKVILDFTKEFYPVYWEQHMRPIVSRQAATRWLNNFVTFGVVNRRNMEKKTPKPKPIIRPDDHIVEHIQLSKSDKIKLAELHYALGVSLHFKFDKIIFHLMTFLLFKPFKP